MPKKPNSWGNMQEYVPAGNGDASGEYADEQGGNIHYKFEPENFGRGKGQVKEEPKKEEEGHISVSKGDGGQSHFQDYLKNEFKPKKGITAEGLERQFNTGTDDAKSVINALIKDGYKINATTNDDSFLGSTVSLSPASIRENPITRNEGEIFYHEFSHGIDEWLAKDVSEQEQDEASESFLSKRSKYPSPDSIWCRSYATATKKLSNGKTLYQTLVDEAKGKTTQDWQGISADFDADVNNKVKEKFGMSKSEMRKRREELNKEFEKKALDDGKGYWSNEYWRAIEKYREENKEYNEINNKLREANFVEMEVGKNWLGISDTCQGSGHASFHGGHSSAYWKTGTARGTKLHRGGEFIAEYCSALCRKDTNGKRELELFNKYFPETSKCAEELFAIAVNKSKGVKA